MKTLSFLLLATLLFTACGTATTEDAANTDSPEAAGAEVAADLMMEDLQDAADIWSKVVEKGADQDMNEAVIQMKAVYGKMYFYVFEGTAPQELVDFADDLNGLLDAAEAGEFEMDFFAGALEEGLGEYEALLGTL